MALGDLTDPVLVKQNDTRPILQYYCRAGVPAVAVNLTGATAVFNMRRTSNGSVVASRATATIPTPLAGLVQHILTTGETAAVDLYEAEFETTLSDGGVLTFPGGGNYIYIRVGDDVA